MHPNKHISSLLRLMFIVALLLSGCAKDELIPPAGGDTFKDFQAESEENVTKHDDSEFDVIEITDDEDDEDDDDRSSNR